MNIKTRLIVSRVITFIMGITIFAIGLFEDNDSLYTMGGVIIFIGAVKLVQTVRILRNSEKLEQVSNQYRDERNIFILHKSYLVSFWVSVCSEFAALIALTAMRMENYASLIAYIICGQIVVYLVSYHVFSRKY